MLRTEFLIGKPKLALNWSNFDLCRTWPVSTLYLGRRIMTVIWYLIDGVNLTILNRSKLAGDDMDVTSLNMLRAL